MKRRSSLKKRNRTEPTPAHAIEPFVPEPPVQPEPEPVLPVEQLKARKPVPWYRYDNGRSC